MTTTRPARTLTTEEIAVRYDRQEALLREEIAALNALLGLTDARHKVTFGYIGNLGNGYDDRTWMVFLPHPGRVGTDEDRIGWFSTGSLDGIVAARRDLAALTKGARLGRQFVPGDF